MRKICVIPGCGRFVNGHGYCKMHYRRWRSNGDPLAVQIILRNNTRRFWSKVDRSSDLGCWRWTGHLSRLGYGVWTETCNGRERRIGAHRKSYELLIGTIPKGKELDHLCRNPTCVNPAHLEPVSHAENVRRGVAPTAINAAKIHCIRGHPFDAENTYHDPRGGRECRLCRAEARRRYGERRRQSA